jgi:hypothetical protein
MSFSSTFIPIDRTRPSSRFEPTTRLEAAADGGGATVAEMSTGRQLAWVFAFWTLIAVAGALSDAFYLHAVGREIDWVQVFRRPLTEQWIWAALTPVVFWLARRVPLARGPARVRPRAARGVLPVAVPRALRARDAGAGADDRAAHVARPALPAALPAGVLFRHLDVLGRSCASARCSIRSAASASAPCRRAACRS